METPSNPFESSAESASHEPEATGPPAEPASEPAFGAEVDEPESPNVLAALEAGLATSIEGLVILDRELTFEGSGRVDFAGVDGAGRLVLVVLLDDDEDAASIEALDLALIARRHADLIARHLDVLDQTHGTQPRCALVAESLGTKLRQRVRLVDADFEMYELQSLASMRGQQTYLVPVEDSGPKDSPKSEEEQLEEITAEDFLVSLEPTTRDTAEVLVARMQRMDSEFDVLFTACGGRWAFQGREFLRLDLRGDRIIGRVMPGGRPLVLDDTLAVENIVEEAFSAYVRLLGLFEDSEAVIEVPMPMSAPLLSPEEIAAFQD